MTARTGQPVRKQRGAPPKPFVTAPERYAINRADAYMALGSSENDAFTAASAQMLGEVVAEQQAGPRRKRGLGLIGAGIVVTYERKAIPGGSAASFDGKASTLRRKAKVAEKNPEAVAWRTAMCRAYVLALAATKDHDLCASIIWELASIVGEGAYAQDVLLPLLEARFFWLAQLSPNDPTKLIR
jgi:hypothetical protein